MARMTRETDPTSRPVTGPAATAWRFGAVGAILVAIGLPVSDPVTAGMLVLAVLLLACLPPCPGPARAGGMAAAVLLSLAAGLVLPVPVIEEGHNIFLIDPDGRNGPIDRMLRQALPAPIHADLRRRFEAAYPRDTRCPGGVSGCWTEADGPRRPFAFSADALFQAPAMSRRVTRVDFDGLAALRAGFVTDHRHTWFDWSSDVTRAALPYFVRFHLPPAFEGGQICWRGMVYLPTAKGFEAAWHDRPGCRAIAARHRAGPIIGARIAPGTELAMRIDPPPAVAVLRVLADAAGWLAMLAIVILAVGRPDRRSAARLAQALALTVAAAITAWLAAPALFAGLVPPVGGEDGLIHAGHGRATLRSLLAGDWQAALAGTAGAETIGSGLRHVVAVGLVLAGDSMMAMLAVVLALPWAILALARPLVGTRMAWLVAVLATATPALAAVGADLATLARLAAAGLPDPVGMLLFLAGAAGVLRLRREAPPGPDAVLAVGLALGGAAWVLPGLALAATGIAVAGVGVLAWQGSRPGSVAPAGLPWLLPLLLLLGFAPAGLLLLARLVGDAVVAPATVAGLRLEWLLAPPGIWVDAAGALLSGHPEAEAVDRVAAQIGRWVGPWPRWPLPLALALLLLWPGRIAWRVRLTAAVAALLHLALLVDIPDGRPAPLAWLLTTLALAGQARRLLRRPRGGGA